MCMVVQASISFTGIAALRLTYADILHVYKFIYMFYTFKIHTNHTFYKKCEACIVFVSWSSIQSVTEASVNHDMYRMSHAI